MTGRVREKLQEAIRVGILSLGCPRNLVDSESILGRLSLKGCSVVDIDKADIGIVNTCAFIEEAKSESIDAILDLVDLKNKGKLKKIIVYGCLAQRYKDKLIKELPEVDAFIGTPSLNHGLERFPLTPKHYAYLKICEGCINNCSYCAIPKIKTKFSSLDIGSIIDRVDIFNRQKVRELNIIGQDITGYGKDLYKSYKLTGLLKKIIQQAKDINWVRLLYLYPNRIGDDLIDLMRSSPKICKYIDLPLQHINSRILKLMHRNTAKQKVMKLIENIRKKIPDAAIRTSFIVGFPSETDKEFKELVGFIKEVKFERLGAFIYSREEGTPAYNFSKQVPREVKVERFNAIMSTQQKISGQVNGKFLGRMMDVLIDGKGKDYYLGRSEYDAPEVDGLVYVRSKKQLHAGDFVKVNITDTLEYDLVGEVQDEYSK
jgi:ribosomal protein S12 methylthiotransferase